MSKPSLLRKVFSGIRKPEKDGATSRQHSLQCQSDDVQAQLLEALRELAEHARDLPNKRVLP